MDVFFAIAIVICAACAAAGGSDKTDIIKSMPWITTSYDVNNEHATMSCARPPSAPARQISPHPAVHPSQLSSPVLSISVELDSNLWGSAYEISVEGFGQSMHAEEKGAYSEVS